MLRIELGSSKKLMAYFCNARNYLSVEELHWIASPPVLILLWEVLIDNVADYTRERDTRIAPRRTKLVVETIVLEIRVSVDTLLR